jgi:hypothetical protein
MRRFLSKEIIFEASVEFGYKLRNKDIYLLDKPMHFENIKVPSLSQVAEVTSNVIMTDLPHELDSIYGIKIKPRIIKIRSGSLQLFFAILLTGYTLIGGYKSFFDSVDLIKQHTKSLLIKNFKEKFNFNDWEITIESRYPSFKRFNMQNILKRLIMKEDFEDFNLSELDYNLPTKKRDGFFYYLLISNCILLVILGFLVYSAIQKTYFP